MGADKFDVFPSSHGTNTFLSSNEISWWSEGTARASAFVTLNVLSGLWISV